MLFGKRVHPFLLAQKQGASDKRNEQGDKQAHDCRYCRDLRPIYRIPEAGVLAQILLSHIRQVDSAYFPVCVELNYSQAFLL